MKNRDQLSESRESVNHNISKYKRLGSTFAKAMSNRRRWRST